MASHQKKLPARFRFTPALFAPDDPAYDGAFSRAPGKALYDWGFEEKPARTDAAGAFLHRIAATFAERLAAVEGRELLRERADVPLSDTDAAAFLNQLPFAPGMEYVTEEWLRGLWQALAHSFAQEVADYPGTVALYLAEKSQHLNVAEKIFFHLIENGADDDVPFSFMATYSTTTSDEYGSPRIEHMPLKYALVEFKHDRKKRSRLLSTLAAATSACPRLAALSARGELFQPLKLDATATYDVLKAIPRIEEAGVVCRIPDWWKKKSHAITLSVRFGGPEASLLGLETILGMDSYLSVDGERLSAEEIRLLRAQTDGLALIKGKWVEVDHQKLEQLIARMELYRGSISLLDAMHMNLTPPAAAPDDGTEESSGAPADDVGVENGAWIASALEGLRAPPAADGCAVPASFAATLRPYQQAGFAWLCRMQRAGFGACLADDMGLGKTVQVLCYLEALRVRSPGAHVLLVVPASLLGNWQKECRRFAPQMDAVFLHGAARAALGGTGNLPFLCATTYTIASKAPALAERQWDVLILDEAQAIKNPLSKQTKAIKAIPAAHRVALTGTPIENDLTNLWSLFDFLDEGLLGTSQEFKGFCKSLPENPAGYAKLKAMIRPFMLRRLKTDKSIISDLPEKIELVDYVPLSKKQRVLYKKYVDDLAQKLRELESDGDPMKKRGLVLASLIKLKQICNHPDQFTGGGTYAEADSGKFAMLRGLCETIYEKRERVLVFTQFKEVCAALDGFLAGVFGTRGMVMHGGTPVKKRGQMVAGFQGDRYVPYMVISVKAGGTGLTLTNANHVVHFDRWWNPAVENQATDRAFRLGQTKNVLVHKLVSRGTIEEKIDELIERKKALVRNVIGTGSGESWITEMPAEELVRLFTLDAEE